MIPLLFALLACSSSPQGDAPKTDAPKTDAPPPPTPNATPAPSTPGSGLPAGLTGVWRSVEDPKSEVHIEGDAWADWYDGAEKSKGNVSASKGCPDGSGANADTLVVAFGSELSCYSVLSISDTALSLSYLPRGNTLAYTRVK